VAALPKKELYILPGKVPATIPEPYLADDLETSQNPHKFRLGKMAPIVFSGGMGADRDDEGISDQHDADLGDAISGAGSAAGNALAS